MSKVIVVGSSNLDYTITVDRLPVAGETILGHDIYQSYGGKGANQAVAAMRAGASVAFLTKLGNDSNGQLIEQHLLSIGIPKEGLLRHGTDPTGVAFILVDQQGRNMIAVVPGSNHTLTGDDVRQAQGLIAGETVLLTQLEIPLAVVREALAIAKAHDVTTILNPAPAAPLSADILKFVDVLTPNESEARALTGISDASTAATVLVTQGVGSVIVTLGEQGALLKTKDRTRIFPPYSVRTVDSTAAGDAFNGALACALAEDRTMEEAIVFANAAGALAVTKRGAQESLPTRAEIDQMSRARV